MNNIPRVAEWDTPAAHLTWPHVQESIDAIEWVVYRHAMEEAQEQFEDVARPCPDCGRAAADLFWVGIHDPEEAWARGAGRSGFLTVCDRCRLQVDFLVDDELTEIAADTYAATGGLP